MIMKDFFEFTTKKTTYKKEFIGALSTFSAMVYIIIVHPTILQSGSLPFGPIMTVTILITAFSTLLMGLLGKVPLAVAPGLGVSAYFTFTLVQKNHLPAPQALFIVFLAAVIILIMNIFKLRKKILESISEELIIGITGGIGLFLIMVGLKQIGAVTTNSSGIISFLKVDPSIAFLTIFGLGMIFVFQKLQIEAAFILSILINWGLSIIFGYAKLNGLFAMPPAIDSVLFFLHPPSYISFDFLKGLLSIFLVTIFDSSAGLLTLKKSLPKEARNFNMQRALYPDAIGSCIGSLMGTSSLAIHLESMAGIHSGARSGFTSVIISLLFICCLFFYPLASSIPTYASSPVIIGIGLIMAKQLKQLLQMEKIFMVAPVLMALTMPITLSLYQGFKVGFITTAILCFTYPKKIKRSPVVIVFSLLFLIEMFLEKSAF